MQGRYVKGDLITKGVFSMHMVENKRFIHPPLYARGRCGLIGLRGAWRRRLGFISLNPNRGGKHGRGGRDENVFIGLCQ